MMLSAFTLWKRELVRFYRQPSRVVGAIGSPLVFWLLIGSGIGASFRSSSGPAGMSYLQYFYPGTLMLILLFTSIFSTISLIEDRKEGFLQSVMVAPVSRFSIVLGKILGGTVLALIQGMIFLLLAPFAGIDLTVTSFISLCLILFLNGFLLTALGFAIAWRFNSVQGFHAVMNLFLFPLWILSGALFPPDGASGWMRVVMTWNPLTYGMNAIRQLMFTAPGGAEPASFGLSLTVTIVFAIILFVLASVMAMRRSARDLV